MIFPARAVFAAILVTACFTSCGTGSSPQPAIPKARIEVPAQERFRPPVRTTVVSGDTIESISRRLAEGQWPRWRDALVTEIDPKSLRPGMVFDGITSPSGDLESLIVSLDLRTEVQLNTTENGIQHHRIERPVVSETVRYEGVIESSLFAAVQQSGAAPELAVRVARIFQWDIDFLRDIRQGDSFIAMVERQTVEGEFYSYGTLYAARFVNEKRELNAMVYSGPENRLGYYDLDGAPLRKQFLRSPLEFSRITSRFSMSRFHPVLHRRIPHYGVDYGAPVGTPVRTTADGVIDFVGRNGGAGRMVRVRHPNGYQTNYLHLSRYAQGMRKGVRVQQGQVVGFVGSSGLSTGPHLDYRVKLNGKWVNPLSITSPAAPPLPESYLKRYLAHALALMHVMDGGETPVGAHC